MNVKEKIGYKIIDNAINKEDFIYLQNIFFEEVPWFYRKQTTSNETREISDYFTHSLYCDKQENSIHFAYVYYLFKQILNIHHIKEIRANLTFSKNKKIQTKFHTDVEENEPYNTSAIFYLNTNNAETILFEKNSIKVDAIENRLLIFDNKIRHCSYFPTDVRRRIILNFNYFDSNKK